jgi:hypothetical protein
MFRAPNLTRMIVIAASIASLGMVAASAADLDRFRQPPTRVTVTYQKRLSRAYACHGGWFQTVYWGHVRPTYAVRCRSFLERE